MSAGHLVLAALALLAAATAVIAVIAGIVIYVRACRAPEFRTGEEVQP